MGDIADSLLDGSFDYITGEYIGEGVGYPRTFEDVFGFPYSIRSGECFSKSKNYGKQPLKGIENYLEKYFRHYNKDEIIKAYGKTLGMPIESKVTTIAKRIQKEFAKFTKWVINNYDNKNKK